jgi:Domain of unknown function (DUF397)
MTDLTNAVWRVSSYTGGNGGNCVEVARNLPGVVAVRDSKDREGPALVVEPRAFAALLAGIRAGEFD